MAEVTLEWKYCRFSNERISLWSQFSNSFVNYSLVQICLYNQSVDPKNLDHFNWVLSDLRADLWKRFHLLFSFFRTTFQRKEKIVEKTLHPKIWQSLLWHILKHLDLFLFMAFFHSLNHTNIRSKRSLLFISFSLDVN